MYKKITETAEWIREYCVSAGASGVAVGLSGGIDSALVAHLIKKAFPQNSLGIILPCHSDSKDREHGILSAESAGLKWVEIDITKAHDIIWSDVKSVVDVDPKKERMSDANLRARLRMSTIYAVANSMNYLVAGTDNAAELLTGYFTKYGDGGVDFLPIATLRKYEVYQWAKLLGVPKEILDKPPSAGLWEGQTDEEEMGVTYREIDDYLDDVEISKTSRLKILQLAQRSQHKKEMPPCAPRF